MTTSKTVSLRSVARVVDGVRTVEGAGFVVRRPFPTRALDHLDPFLLLDEMGPSEHPPGEAHGAPDHPHRGFETVTYLLDGEMEHRDSAGNAGKLGPGSVQWMTAGAGVVHSEMPSADFQRNGGRMHGFQLWVNLPAADKMMPPRYQELTPDQLPSAHTPDGRIWVRAIAGEALGVRSQIQTRTPIIYLHFRIQPRGEVLQPVPSDYNAFAYVISGAGRFGREGRPAGEGQMVLFGGDGSAAVFGVPAEAEAPLELLLIAGEPLREPVVRYGPFVMNTQAEIAQAIDDFRAGRMGRIG